jgi:predicted ester cyclase
MSLITCSITVITTHDDAPRGRPARERVAGASATRGETMTTSEEAKSVVRNYLDAFNRRDRERLSDLLAGGVVEHGIHEELHGPEEIVEFLDAHFETFPDYSGETEAMVAEGDTVTVRYTVQGTHEGEYQDVEPTGNTAEWTGIAMYRVEDGAIAEVWLEEDRLGLLEQLEVVDPPAHLRI